MWISIGSPHFGFQPCPRLAGNPLARAISWKAASGVGALGARKRSCHGAPVAGCTESATRSVPIPARSKLPELIVEPMYSTPLSRSAEVHEIERLMRKKPLPPLEGDRAVDLLAYDTRHVPTGRSSSLSLGCGGFGSWPPRSLLFAVSAHAGPRIVQAGPLRPIEWRHTCASRMSSAVAVRDRDRKAITFPPSPPG